MKKILLLATLVLGMVSCMKDQSLDANLAGDGNFVLSVALPNEATRAAGTDSAKGAIDNGILDEYDVRYTLEVYDVNDQLAKRDQHTVNSDKTSFELRLIPGRHYRFVVWADFVKAGVDPYYNVANLREVSLTGTHNAMNESRDAYTAVFNTAEDGDKEVFSSASSIEMTLTRPFAKLRVVAIDHNEIVGYSTPTNVVVKFDTEHNPIYKTFNAINNEISNTCTTHEYEKYSVNPAPYKEYSATTDKGENITGLVLFSDYILAQRDGQQPVSFSMDIYDENNAPIRSLDFETQIPICRNHLTTIVGYCLTKKETIIVNINDTLLSNDEFNKDAEDVTQE